MDIVNLRYNCVYYDFICVYTKGYWSLNEMGRLNDVLNNFSYLLATASFFYALYTTSIECFNSSSIYFSLENFE